MILFGRSAPKEGRTAGRKIFRTVPNSPEVTRKRPPADFTPAEIARSPSPRPPPLVETKSWPI